MAMTGHDFVVEAKAQIKEVSPDQAFGMVQQGCVVLDVREGEEYLAGHLPGAIHIPRGVLEFKVTLVPQTADKAKSLLVYCKTGGRAALSALALQKMGYTQVVSMAGGFDQWVAGGRQVDKPVPINYE